MSELRVENKDVSNTLTERGNRYGEYRLQAMAVEQIVDDCLTRLQGWNKAQPIQRNAARYIVDKLCRAFNGDPYYEDNWHDIQGYARLVETFLLSSAAKKLCDGVVAFQCNTCASVCVKEYQDRVGCLCYRPKPTSDVIRETCIQKNVSDLGCVACEHLETTVEDKDKIPTAWYCKWRDGGYCTRPQPNNDGVPRYKFELDQEE